MMVKHIEFKRKKMIIINKVVIIGRLTRDPELKFLPGDGKAVATFTLAVDRKFSKDGQKEADYIPVVAWGKQAESTANYMSKGKLMAASGRIQTRNYTAKDGNKRYVTEVVADEVQFLEWGNSNKGNSENNDEKAYEEDVTPVDDGDIPF